MEFSSDSQAHSLDDRPSLSETESGLTSDSEPTVVVDSQWMQQQEEDNHRRIELN